MKLKVYISDGAIQFFDHNEDAIPDPTDTFFRAVPVGALTIAETQQQDYVVFSQSNNNGGEPTVIRAVAISDVINESDVAYLDISDIISDLMPTAGGGGGGSAPNIADWKLSIDTDNDNYLVWTLTVFNPATNQPTRSFFELDGVTPYVASPENIVTPDALTPSLFTKIGNLEADVALIRGQLGLTTAVGGNQSLSAKIRAAGTFTVVAGARKITIISTAVSFIAGGVTYPITTTNGGKIDMYNSEATVGRRLTELTYVVAAGGSAIELVMN